MPYFIHHHLQVYVDEHGVVKHHLTKKQGNCITPPRLALWQCQSKTWINEEGGAEDLIYQTSTSNYNCSYLTKVIVHCDV